MRTIETPMGNFPVEEEGERMLERALQRGERYNFKLSSNGSDVVTLTGFVRRVPSGFVLDTGPAPVS